MINITLFRKEMKANYILFLIFAGVLTIYASIIVTMFDPKPGDSLTMMMESMPELFAAFGMANATTTLLEFVNNYLYGMLFIAFPSIYIIILSNRLITRYVDNGSISYLLATPHKRKTLARTQAIFLILSLLLLIAYLTMLVIATSEAIFPGELEIQTFLQLNVGLFSVFIFFSGICFFFSCFFSESKYCLGASAAIVIYSLFVQMISQVGDKLEKLKYATPLTLFDTQGFITSNTDAWVGCAVLYVVGIAGYIAGIAYFDKKNLSV